ncbi:MAG: hypothetical protein DDT33_01693 [Firmicutes bacterium]|nr:hypothetical protein [Bacillota bacterium]
MIGYMAKKAIEERKGFEFMIYWMKQSPAWQRKAKKIFRQELKRAPDDV